MTEKKRTSGLGRGLSDLLGDSSTLNEDISELDRVKQHKLVNIELLAPSPYQPRHTFDEESLNNLVDSIKEKGVLQPLLVRRDPNDNNRYEIIAGERRFRASQLAGLKELPVIVKEMSDKEVLEVALIENIQRQDLNAIEEAEGYNRLIEEFNHTQEELSKIVGKSRSHVANTMRLLTLSEKIKNYVIEGKLTAGHARALITAKNPEEIADKVISKGLNVRQVEKLAQSSEKNNTASSDNNKSNTEQKQDDAKALSQEIEKMIGTKVTIKFKDRGGEMTISFANNVILDILLKRLTEEGLLVDNGVLVNEKKTDNNSVTETITDNSDASAIVDTIMGEEEQKPAVSQQETESVAAETAVMPDTGVTENDTNIEDLSQEQIVIDDAIVSAAAAIGEEIKKETTEEMQIATELPPETVVTQEDTAKIETAPVQPTAPSEVSATVSESVTSDLQSQVGQQQNSQPQGMTKEEVEKLLQETIEDVKPNFDGLENIITNDTSKDFKIPDKQEIIFDENVKI